ncbi:MAG: peptidase S24 [Thiomonas sp. 20-64-5]|jgi:DNA polymerase V|uniref:LexA family protein n=1 Tax=unclassified Thiomonas TaxID=2625466 RepID=UPI000BD2E90F|nr:MULTISPECIES: translesion error-prone DNA polymerase V autoproteolytic subunit [unclassified Thiomonas]OYV41059.1 MAG: peptidase S24 [Thiomonas sp. 20-64-5]OZB70588.1 MAG: peptidase S24 [Thiomonas sp. 13-64-67]
MNSLCVSLHPLDTRAILMGQAEVGAPMLRLPMGAARVAMGFPSPAEDFEDDSVDLNELLVRNPPATFLYRATGWSMIQAGICDGDVLIMDRSVRPQDGDVVIAVWDGNAPVCKVLHVFDDRIELHSRNPRIAPIVLSPDTEVEIFAVVGVARQMRREHGRVGRQS